MIPRLLAVLLLAVLPAAGRARAPSCPFLPQYARLQAAIAAGPAAVTLKTLYDYAADPANENPAACEAIELDRQIGDRERELVTLVSATHPPIRADATFHCTTPDPRTTQCDGIVADGTAQPDARRLRPSTPVSGKLIARLVSHLPEGRLVALYRTSVAAIADGRPPTRIDPARSIVIAARPGGTVLIALMTAPRPYKVRKLVWYY